MPVVSSCACIVQEESPSKNNLTSRHGYHIPCCANDAVPNYVGGGNVCYPDGEFVRAFDQVSSAIFSFL
jgi:hypothetical protein